MDEATRKRLESRGLPISCPAISSPSGEVVYQNKYYPWKLPAVENTPTFSKLYGLGAGFEKWGQYTLVEFLDDYLDIPDILKLASTTREWLFIASSEKLWRRFARRLTKGNLEFYYTWKLSVTQWHNEKVFAQRGEQWVRPAHLTPSEMMRRVQTPPFWEGEMLKELQKVFDQWYRATADPRWMGLSSPETIDRRAGISLEDFIEEYEKPGKPVLLTDITEKWKGASAWAKEHLLSRHGDAIFRTGSGFKLSLKNFFKYLDTQHEHKPLYLFDQNYPTSAPEMMQEYSIPEYWKEDLFGLAGEDERPPWRWILYGPAGSGVPFHTDPRGTSAWNAVLYGGKRWAMYPPTIHPPGVGPDDDDYYNAPTALKWWLKVYPLIIHPEMKPLECHQLTGETIFIPSGWWHTVYNTEETMAITQNFASTANFERVAADLIESDDEFANLFKDVIKDERPDLYETWKRIEASKASSSSSSSCSSDSE